MCHRAVHIPLKDGAFRKEDAACVGEKSYITARSLPSPYQLS